MFKKIFILIAIFIFYLLLVNYVFNIALANSNPIDINIINESSLSNSKNNRLVVVKINPKYFKFNGYYYKTLNLKKPVDVINWYKKIPSTIIINPGFFTPEYTYLGYFFSNGKNYGTRGHKTFKGLFIAQNSNSGSVVKIIDLNYDNFNIKNYKKALVVQSFMLFDKFKKCRIKVNEKTASRTAMAIDKQNYLYIFITTGEYTLINFCHLLKSKFPQLINAIAFDGGSSAQLLIHYLNSYLLVSEDTLIQAKQFNKINSISLAPLPYIITANIEPH